jgi:hypothetical protein
VSAHRMYVRVGEWVRRDHLNGDAQASQWPHSGLAQSQWPCQQFLCVVQKSVFKLLYLDNLTKLSNFKENRTPK